ncbi:MAG: hypothetical protein WAT23_06600 [Chromatiaceae bacterium]
MSVEQGSGSHDMVNNKRMHVNILPRSAILVLGMHRSGTSAFTRTMNFLGADLPSNLMPPSPGNNETGFWESMDVYNLNEEILRSVGSSWDDWRPFNPDWFLSNVVVDFRHVAMEILDQDFSSSSLFVLKDPRICRLLPFWVEVIRQANTDLKCLIPIRNPIEVAESLRCRDGFSLEKSLVLWLRHILDAEHDSRSLRRAFAFYEELLADWRGEASRFSAGLGVVWPRRTEIAEVEIDAFLKSHLRHHVITLDRVNLLPAFAIWIKDVYSSLGVLKTDPSSEDALARLDGIREEFDRASAILGAITQEEKLAVVKFKIELARCNTRLHEVSAEITQCENRLEKARATLVERDANLNTVTAELNQRDAWVNRLKSDLGEERRRNQTITQLRNQFMFRLSDIQQSPSWWLSLPIQAMERRWPVPVKSIASLSKLVWWGATLRLPWRLHLRRQAMRLLEQKLFDFAWYIERNPDIVLQGLNPIMHWLDVGWKQQRDPSPLFDCQWYLSRSPDVAAAGVNPLIHYLDKGGKEGRSPHPLFDGPWYLERYPDAASSGINPLVHYLSRHPRERRDPHPLFDANWYLDQDRDVETSSLNPLVHYLVWKGTAWRNPNPFFDSAWYLEQYPEVAGDGINPLIHYVRWGAWEGKNPSPRFDTSWYLQQHSELADLRTNPLAHFLQTGIEMGWPALPPDRRPPP